MPMDWANEKWVRLYTRDTTTWKLIGWQGRTVLLHLFRKVDRSGVLDVGDDGMLGLVAMLELPEEVVEDGLAKLIERGVVLATTTAYSLPNFLEAQETPQSDAQRQRMSREGKRARTLASGPARKALPPGPGGGVTNRDRSSRDSDGGAGGGDRASDDLEPGDADERPDAGEPSRFVTGESRNVTDGHAESREVTIGHSETSLDETSPDEREEILSGKPDGVLVPLPARRDPASELAIAAVAEVNRIRGSKGHGFDPKTAGTVKLCRALLKRFTAAQVLEAVTYRAAQWITRPTMAEYVRPSSLLTVEQVEKTLDEIRAGPARASPGSTPAGRTRGGGFGPVAVTQDYEPVTGEQTP